jgi:predicted alpha/beta-fold hydrolase
MPVIHGSTYRAPFLFSNGHLQTLYPTMARTVNGVAYQRERITTPDDDFLDLDWSRIGNGRLAILSHGLEGNTRRPYMVGMARMLNRHGWDVLAWNYRACSGEINRRLRMYHNGCIDDLDCVVQHALKDGRYGQAALIGFSLGGNLTLMYLGSMAEKLDARIHSSVVFSVPCDLRAGALELAKAKNYLYMKQFLVSLHKKIRQKMEQMPGRIDDEGYGRIRDFKGFDDRYTAPINGFRDAEDYWFKCSSGRFLSSIAVPTLIVNALDDPFLAPSCYPVAQAEQSKHVHLEMPASGGHVGFVQFNSDGSYWSENRAVEFLGREW